MFHLRVHPAGVEIMSSSGKVKFKAEYTQSMQVCGARGGGDAASHGVYLCLQPNLALMLVRTSPLPHQNHSISTIATGERRLGGGGWRGL
jgi:hypothetical protein